MVTTPIPVNPSQARYAWMVAVMGVEHVLMEWYQRSSIVVMAHVRAPEWLRIRARQDILKVRVLEIAYVNLRGHLLLLGYLLVPFPISQSRALVIVPVMGPELELGLEKQLGEHISTCVVVGASHLLNWLFLPLPPRATSRSKCEQPSLFCMNAKVASGNNSAMRKRIAISVDFVIFRALC